MFDNEGPPNGVGAIADAVSFDKFPRPWREHRRCVSDVLKVDPTLESVEPYIRACREPTESFRLVFQFQSGRIIEIESESVEIVPVA